MTEKTYTEEIKDLLMPVGGSFYPRIEDYVSEAKKLGCCKRIGKLPKNIKVGVSRVFLVHFPPLPPIVHTSEEFIAKVKKLKPKSVIVWDDSGVIMPEMSAFHQAVYGDKPTMFLSGAPVVFGYFTIRSIEMVVKKGTNLPKELADRGVKPVELKIVESEPPRGCGQRVWRGIYLLSEEEDLQKLRDLSDETDIEGQITVFEKPIPFKGKKFRGFKYV